MAQTTGAEMTVEPLMSVEEVAEYFHVHPETVRQWLRRGELHGMNLGRRAGWRVRRSDVEAFMRQRERRARPESEDFEVLRILINVSRGWIIRDQDAEREGIDADASREEFLDIVEGVARELFPGTGVETHLASVAVPAVHVTLVPFVPGEDDEESYAAAVTEVREMVYRLLDVVHKQDRWIVRD